jgi:alpha-tubulin suppressor-like RCC1 family protein
MEFNSSLLSQRLAEEVEKTYLLADRAPGELLSLALTATRLGEANLISVPTVENLPSLVYASLPDGMIYYIEDLGIFVFNVGSRWLTLDGVEVRQDSSINLLWTWGANSQGQLGDNSVVSQSSPVSVAGGKIDWKSVSAGILNIGGITTTGRLFMWGVGASGRIGDNTIINQSSPVLVAGGITNWCHVSVGDSASLGVTKSGQIFTWGCNGLGQLGDGTVVSKSSPVLVVGNINDWCLASAGCTHMIGITVSGSAWAWGVGTWGVLGDGTTANKSSPVSVVGDIANWCQVSAARTHNLGVTTSGEAWAWGIGLRGVLGDGTTVSRSSPVSVVGNITNWCQVSAGYTQSLGLTTAGVAWAWGYNNLGQLGDGTLVDKNSPVSVIGGITNWTQVSTGDKHSLGVTASGTAWAWGAGVTGGLGTNDTNNTCSPTLVAGSITGWCQISAGCRLSGGVAVL